MVSCHNDDDTISMVEVEFHNASTYHSFSVPNNIGWTMASLSEQALLLAVEKIESEPRYIHVLVLYTQIYVHILYRQIYVHVYVLYTQTYCTCMYMYMYYTHRHTCMYMYM